MSASSLHVCRAPISEAVAKAPSPKPGAVSTATGTDTVPIAIPRWKRVLDVTLILLSVPLWLPIALLIMLWIKMVSPGSIFFRQERIGFRGTRFMILKFRTMKVNVETQSHEKYLEQLINANVPMTKLDSAGDPRIIAGGRILRATGLDELPQLFNVLRGEMSLIGPRPCTPHEFRSYQSWQQARVNALPGLTGYWQVNGKNKTTFTEMIEMDIFYTKNQSLRLDLMIILKTVPAILAQVLESRIRSRLQAGTAAQSSSNVSVPEKCS
jgi:lipopolysaccharide/colanic/teichoic acid biosynthesis glycosyltransferase